MLNQNNPCFIHVLEWPVCKRNYDAECPRVKEHQPLLAKNSDKPTQKGMFSIY